MRDQEKALTRIYHALKPGGKLLALVFPRESEYFLPFQEVISSQPWLKYKQSSACVSWLSSEDYRSLLQKIGFHITSFQCTKEEIRYDNRKIYQQRILAWLSCMISLPQNLLQRFLDDASDLAYKRYGSASSEELCITYKKLVFYVEKPLQHRN